MTEQANGNGTDRGLKHGWQVGPTVLVVPTAAAWANGPSSIPGAGTGGGGSSTGGAGDATTTAPGDGAAAPDASSQGSGLMQWFLPVMIAMLGLMIFTSFSSQRKEKKKREALLSGVGTNDRVQTVGGIIGTVSAVHGDEIVLKVDEQTNTRIRFSKSAVQQVLRTSGDAKREADESVESEGKDAA